MYICILYIGLSLEICLFCVNASMAMNVSPLGNIRAMLTCWEWKNLWVFVCFSYNGTWFLLGSALLWKWYDNDYNGTCFLLGSALLWIWYDNDYNGTWFLLGSALLWICYTIYNIHILLLISKVCLVIWISPCSEEARSRWCKCNTNSTQPYFSQKVIIGLDVPFE